MNGVSVDDLLKLVTQGGGLAVMGFVVIGFLKGWIVPGPTYKDLLQDRDDWKEAALTSVNGVEKAVDLSERRRKDGSRANRTN